MRTEKANRGAVQAWLLRALEAHDGPVSVRKLKSECLEAGVSKSGNGIQKALSSLLTSGRIRRIGHGRYEALRTNGADLDPPPPLSAQKSDEIVDDLEDDILCLEGLIAAWRDEKGVAEIRVRELGERIAAYERNLAWRKTQLERRRKRCVGSGS